MDTNSQYWGGAASYSTAPPRPSGAGTELISRFLSDNATLRRIFSVDAPTSLLEMSKSVDAEESDVTVVAKANNYFRPKGRAVASGTEFHASAHDVGVHPEQGALAKASKYRAQLLQIQESGSQISDEILARLSILNRRLDLLAPRVTPEQWQRLEQSAGIAESAADLRVRVRDVLRGC
ncbi:hypothetical protein [Stenotrophomonas sp. YIM B06876]|uniref:hypothetical protein n=1 Tax=Stenotrophomonas sp. YIM B06876 TaxID=3060211 RepID=UPI002738FA62|nr:hypothetical protein [Stenotrophomonas sp. YIM B06876]